MTDLKLTKDELQVIENMRLEAQKLEQEKLKQEKATLEKLKKRAESIIKYKEFINSNTRKFYDILIENGCDKNTFILSETIIKDNVRDYNQDIKYGFEYKHVEINTPFGSIGNVNSNLKAELPYSITSRYQEYTAKGAVKKILQKIESDKRKINDKNKLEQVGNDLEKLFQNEYPDATILKLVNYEFKKGFKQRFTLNEIKISFPNSSWVKIRYYGDGSWNVYSHFDSKFPNKKEDIIAYLAS